MSALSSATSTRATVLAGRGRSTALRHRPAVSAGTGSQRSASWTNGSARRGAPASAVAGASWSAGRWACAERQPDGEGGAGTRRRCRRSIVPPCSADQFLHQGQADAAALVERERAPADAVEPLEQPWHLLGRHPDAGVGDLRTAARRRAATATRMPPSKVNLSALLEQIEDDLLPHVAIHVDRLGQRRAVDVQGQAGPLDRGAEHAGQLGGEQRPGRPARTGPASARPRCARSRAAR